MKRFCYGSLAAAVLMGWVGCANGPFSGESRSPTGALLRGEIAADQYFSEVKRANEDTRRQQQFEVDRDSTRAYNIRTGQVEYVPEDTQQFWNPERQRWEFVPVEDRPERRRE